MPETTLLLVRHGATRANLLRPYTLQGLRPDSELDAVGIAQAEATAQALRSYPIVQVYCSPLRRARRTAQILAATLDVPLEMEEGLAEADVGEWAGLTWEEVGRRWPEEFRVFHDNPERNGYLGGENLRDVAGRSLPVIERLVARHEGQTILAVSHGTVNRVLLATFLGLPLRRAREIPQDNGAFNVIELKGATSKVQVVNAVAHLAALPK
jgi:broad specificity phosphatase PhoE